MKICTLPLGSHHLVALRKAGCSGSRGVSAKLLLLLTFPIEAFSLEERSSIQLLLKEDPATFDWFCDHVLRFKTTNISDHMQVCLFTPISRPEETSLGICL